MLTISIITPWLNASELIGVYEKSVQGAEAIVIDNGSDWLHAERIEQMVKRLGGVYIRNDQNRGFSTANNQGLEKATGDVVIFMNNDVECQPTFLERVRMDVKPGEICGPSLLHKHGYDYIEGWCIAAYRDIWQSLGGWDDKYYTGLYWEDNDLCFRAVKAGYKLKKTIWPVWHFNNYTTSKLPGAYDHSASNEALFLKRTRGEE